MSPLSRTPRVLLTALGLAAIVVSGATCGGGDSTGPQKPVITSLVRMSGDGQTGPVAQALPTKLAVKVLDQNGAPMAGVTVTWTVRSGGGSISATGSTTDAAGLNTATWTLGPTPGSDTVSARLPAAASIAPVTFAATAVAGAPAALTVTAQPTTVTAGAAITPPVQVTIQDAQGNTVTSANTPVTVAITAGTGTAGAALSGTKTRSAAGGVATFDDLSIDKTGNGYTLTATGGGLPATATAAFPVTPGAAAALAFTTQPVTAAAGAPIAVQVTARDAQGNTATGFTGTVSLSLTAGTGTAGAHLLGTTSLAATAGIASFTALSVDSPGTGYTLTASASGPASATSASFAVTAGAVSAAQSTVAASPASIAADGSIATITVTAKDSYGNPIAGATVVLAATGTGNTLTQPVGTTNASGVATGTLSSTVAEAKTISATIGGVAITQTAGITVTAGAISPVTSLVTISSATVVSSSTVTLTLQGKDAHGNTVTTGGATVVFTAGGGTSTGSIGATTDHADGTYTAVFTGVTAGTATTIGAMIGGTAVTATLPTVTVTPGPISAAQSTVTASPTSISADGGSSTVTVTAKDAHNNPIAGATVVLAATGTGNTLTQPVGTTNAGGVATGTLSSTVAEAKTVSATIGGVAVTQTAAVTVNPGAATSLAFTTQPPISTGAGVGFSPVVTARDAHGNAASSFTGNVTASITSGTGTTGAHLLGTTTVAAASGVATFGGLNIDSLGIGYTLTATAAGTAAATSSTFAITPGPISTARSAVTVSQGTVRSDSSVTLTLRARDQFGNPLTTGGSTVLFGASGGTSTGSVSGTTDHGDGTYSATFTGVLAGTATTIRPTIDGSAVTSPLPNVVVIPDFATRLIFHVQPTDAAANTNIAPAVVVYAVDNAGNTDPNYQFGVVLQITSGTGTSGASLTGGGPVLAVLGVATFAGVRIDLAGSGYRLDAIYIASPPYNLTTATSSAFTITP